MAQQMKTKHCVLLDGDTIRGIYSTGFSFDDRWNHNIRVAKIAKMLDEQGIDVIVSLICPYIQLRKKVEEICGCGWIFLDIEPKDKNHPYEKTEKYRYVQSL